MRVIIVIVVICLYGFPFVGLAFNPAFSIFTHITDAARIGLDVGHIRWFSASIAYRWHDDISSLLNLKPALIVYLINRIFSALFRGYFGIWVTFADPFTIIFH